MRLAYAFFVHIQTQSQYRLALTIAVAMHLSQQLSGMVAIFYYSTDFFQDAGVPKDRAQVTN